MSEFASLVHDTLLFLKQEGVIFPDHRPVAPPPKVIVKEKAKAPPPETPSKGWDLHPMSTPSSEQPAFGQHIDLIHPTVPIVLILPTEEASHRLFLENVARAITRQLAPARVLLGSEKIDASVKLVVRSEKNRLSHQLYEKDGLTILPLEDLDNYLNDRNLKLSLWNLLKTFPSSRLSS